MLSYFAATDPGTGITNYLFTQGVLGVVCVMLIVVVIYLSRKLDKKELRIDQLQTQLLTENKTHAADYKEMAKDNQEVLQLNSQNSALLTAKIEAVKGRR
jgi:hypothetical protein